MRRVRGRRLQKWATVSVLMCAGLVTLPHAAYAPDVGVGRRAAAVAEIDLVSAVAGSTEVRSLATQEADAGKIEIRDVASGTALGSAGAKKDGQYAVRVIPLAGGQVIQAVKKRKALNIQSSAVTVTTAAPPVLKEPVAAGTRKIRGWGTPGHTIQIVNAVTREPLGSATTLGSPGNGRFKITVPKVLLFHSIQATDGTLMGKTVPILNLARKASAIPENCPSDGGQQAVAGFSATVFRCSLNHPRGIAADAEGNIYIAAGDPPSDPAFNLMPLGVFRLAPPDGRLTLFAPVSGVALRFGPGGTFGSGLFVARPRVFNVRTKVIVDRGDGEVFNVTPNGQARVFTRLLDVAPTGVAFDTTGAFSGDLVVSSFLGDRVVRIGKTTKAQSALANAPGIQGLAFGPGGAFGTDLYAAQPGTGKVLRITPSGAVTTFVSNLVSPVELAFGPGGKFGTDLYVSDAGAGKVLRIDGSGVETTLASRLKAPFGLAFSTAPAALWITDYATGQVVRIS